MPTAVGPFSFSTAFIFSAIVSKASSHDTGSNSPSLSKTPPRFLISGVVSRSAPYMILDRK